MACSLLPIFSKTRINAGADMGAPSIAVITSQAFSLINFRGPLISRLVEKGLRVFALAPDFDEKLRKQILQYGAIPIDCSLSRAGMNPIRDFVDILRLFLLLKRLAPDITLTYFIKPVMYGSTAAWLAGVPKRFSMIEGLGYVFMDDAQAISVRRRLLRWGVLRLYKLSLACNLRVFFLNNDDITYFLDKNMVSNQQIAYIDGIGVDLGYYKLEPPVTRPVTFLYIGRMLREKGVYDFVEAARLVRLRFSEARFLLVGGVDFNPGSIGENEILEWVEEGLVEWTGHVDDVRQEIQKASVFVLPSYREGKPRSTQEAMAAGRPVITTEVPGCRETVKNGLNGYLVEVRNPGELAEAMVRFAENPDLIITMGREGRHLAEKRFNVHVINQEILTVMGIS
jgi:glycosyltransferase involved in cell wall biosynthesis